MRTRRHLLLLVGLALELAGAVSLAGTPVRATRELESKKEPASKKNKAFEQECLAAHNKYRRLHNVPELQFDKKIAAFAQKRADFIAASDGVEFKHPKDLDYGENLAWHSRNTKTCDELVKMWYDEVELYNFKRKTFSVDTGHFTQLVWKATSRVGCARALSSGPRGGIYLVCNYDPPGNWAGEEDENIFPAKARSDSREADSSTVKPAAPRELAPSTSPRPASTTSASTSTSKRPKGKKKKPKKSKKAKKDKKRKSDARRNKKKRTKAKGPSSGQTSTTTSSTTSVAPIR